MGKLFFGKTGSAKPSYAFIIILIAGFFHAGPVFSIQDTATVSDTGTIAVQGADTLTHPDTSAIQDSAGIAIEAEEDTVADDHVVAFDGHSRDDVTRGKRFFLGILPFERTHQACVSCHALKPSEDLDWNPSAIDLARKYSTRSFAEFQNVVLKPSGKVIEAAHQNIDIPEEDLRTVKAYLDNLATEGLPQPKMSINNLLLFLFLGLLITWAILELIFFRKIKYKLIPVAVLLIAFGWQVQMLVNDAIRLGRQEGYAPDQPIKFSHKVHVGENGIDCKYCHTTVEYSKSAGIPSNSLCMNCHIIIREGTNSGKFEIAKAVEANELNKPIEWIRIHNLPDHVFFNHAVHVGSAKIDCNVCHGPVEEMEIMRQHADLSMGWCVNCHRETKVPGFEENNYYEEYVKLHEDLRSGKIDSVTAQDLGANDCMRCHY